MKRLIVVGLFFLTLTGIAFSQVITDSLDLESSHILNKNLQADSIIHRSFDQKKIDEFKNSGEFDYQQSPTGLSLWQRFKIWLTQMLNRLFQLGASVNWVKVLIVIAFLALLIFVILRLLKVDAKRLFFGTQKAPIEFSGLDENIHEMDFDRLVAEALSQNDLRKAIRLVFLHALKLLSDKGLIDWKPGKTNHDYLSELTGHELKQGFSSLNRYFEYAWYGNFTISEATFNKVYNLFETWRKDL